MSGQVALVTGGARGQGAAHAEALASAGMLVVIADILDDDGARTAAALSDRGLPVRSTHLDVADERAWRAVIADIEAREGGLDVLVNNAGIEVLRPIVDTTLEEWRRVQSVNVDGVFLGCKHALAAMRPGGAAGRGGAIVNLSSIAGLVGTPGLTAYCASKGAVRLLTKAAAVESGRFGYGVRINSVHPGLIDTPMLQNLFRESAALGLAASEAESSAMAYAQQAMHELRAVPQDIANVVLFLASDAARYVTGAEWVADGGFTAA